MNDINNDVLMKWHNLHLDPSHIITGILLLLKLLATMYLIQNDSSLDFFHISHKDCCEIHEMKF